MLYNLKITLRNLKKNRLYSIINIAGLAVSLAVCSFILLWVQDERSYDRFHKDAEDIYLSVVRVQNAGIESFGPYLPHLLAQEAHLQFPNIKSYCRIRNFQTDYVLSDGINTGKKNVLVTDSTFFSFFNFPIIKGFSQRLFHQPDEVVISESLATEMFGDNNPIGKIIRVDDRFEQYEKELHVVAVMKDFPLNTYLPRADLIIHWKSEPDKGYLNWWNSWENIGISFFRLNSGTDVHQLEKGITNLLLQYLPHSQAICTLQKIVNLHLYGLDGRPSQIRTVRIFIWIACAILVIAGINYVNLITARSVKRNREVGLKKILGARRTKLFFQLMTEALLLFMTATIIAVFLSVLSIGIFNHVSGKEIHFEWNNRYVWMIYGGLFLAVIILAGIYPAVSLSSFRLLNMLQGKLTNKGNSLLRRSLVVFQFIASVILILTTITFESQLAYIRKMNLGYDQEYVFTCPTYNMKTHFETVQGELLREPSILSVSAGDVLSDIRASNTTREWEGKIDEGEAHYYRLWVDSTFFKNMSMEFVEGSSFGPGAEKQYIINETMAKTMGLTEPIVGKWMAADFGIRGKIVGVVKDFYYHSLYQKISPLVIFPIRQGDWAPTIYVRTTAKDAGRAIAAVEKLWKEYNPKYVFTYNFLDESFERLYKSDIRTGRLFMVFSLISILICCLGLFGLVTYTAEAKYKEIGIRKVLGASVRDIVTLLLKEFAVLIGIAMLIAFPLAYYWLDSLLQDFAYRISIGWWIFVVSGMITILLTLLSVGWKAFKAASANPVDAIKME